MSDNDPEYVKLLMPLKQSLCRVLEVRQIRSNPDRVQLVETSYLNPRVYKMIDDIVKYKKKNKRAANGVLTVAKKAKEDNEIFFALRSFNEMLAVAPRKWLPKAYAGRSLVYFNLGLYKECMQNIEWALGAGLEDEMKPELLECQQECTTLLANYQEPNVPNFEIKLTGNANPSVPFLSDAIVVATTARYGRSLRATRDLNIGDIIAIEPAECSVLGVGTRLMRCANCMRNHKINLIPCPKCTGAMFCSQACMDEANSNFHDIECPIIEALHSLMSSEQLVAVRLIIRGVKLFGTVEKFHSEGSRWLQNKKTGFGIDYRSADDKDKMAVIHNLYRAPDAELTSKELSEITLISAVAVHLFIDHTALKELTKTTAQRNDLINLVFHYMTLVGTNARPTTTLCSRTERDHLLKLKDPPESWSGWGVYPVCSLINHSCAPNIISIRSGTHNVIVVSKPIKNGFHIFDFYGINHMKYPLQQRQRALEDLYKFHCRCEACKYDYPLFIEKEQYEGLPNINEAVIRTDALDWEYVSQHIDFYRDYLKANPKYPEKNTDHATTVWHEMYQILVMDRADMALGHQLPDVAIATTSV